MGELWDKTDKRAPSVILNEILAIDELMESENEMDYFALSKTKYELKREFKEARK